MSKKYYKTTNTHTTEDSNGNITVTTDEKITAIENNTEPDYIKLYTRMWCEFNEIPMAYRSLFLALAQRMSYASLDTNGNSKNNGGQIVYTGKPIAQNLMAECGWTSEQMLKKGLSELCKCNAIKRIGRGVYQINPSYAGRGLWKYNAKKEQGGIENLVATFDFKNKTVDTKVVYATYAGQQDENGELIDTAIRDNNDKLTADSLVCTQTTIQPTIQPND